MGHYLISVAGVDRLGLYEGLAMYQAALRDEQRRFASAAYIAHPGTPKEPGKLPHEISPWAYPERRFMGWTFKRVDKELEHEYERYALAEDITVDEAKYGPRAAPWRWTSRLDPQRLKNEG